jgi:hypothetical protein
MLGAENLSLHYSTVPIGFDASGAGQSPILIWGEREMSNPDRTLDAKTLYNATQTEMNSRLQIRTNIHISHLTIIVQDHVIIYLLPATIPLISYYFISLYLTNEANLKNLERELVDLKRMCGLYVDGGLPSRFIHKQPFARLSRDRVISLVGSCFVSPVVVVADLIYQEGQSAVRMSISGLLFLWCLILSIVNYKRVRRIEDKNLLEDVSHQQ